MDIKEILNKAFRLGQTYWQQADSEYVSQHKKADLTLDKFNDFSLAVEMDITSAKFQIDEIKKQRNDLVIALEHCKELLIECKCNGTVKKENAAEELAKIESAIAAARGE